METINILVSLDENYIEKLKIMLCSLVTTHVKQKFNIFLLYSNFSKETLDSLKKDLKKINCDLIGIEVPNNLFSYSKTTNRYPKEMYYRLLAGEILPKEVKKILYLDPDILIINQIYNLWNLDINGKLFAAASHSVVPKVVNEFNKIRLESKEEYFNSGVLLINLEQCRKEINENEIMNYIKKNKNKLLLPDQDVLNALYGNRVQQLDDRIWNYDARKYREYLIDSGGECNIDWVMNHTAILHFCGRRKPWKSSYQGKFKALYQHYSRLTKIYMSD